MALPMRLAGEMVVHEGAAYLRLAPEAATAAASAPRGAAAAPGGPDLDATKPPTHADIMRNVNSEAIVLRNTRRGLTLDEHRSRSYCHLLKAIPAYDSRSPESFTFTQTTR